MHPKPKSFDDTKTNTNMDNPRKLPIGIFRRHNHPQMVWLRLVHGKRQKRTIRRQLPFTKRITGISNSQMDTVRHKRVYNSRQLYVYSFSMQMATALVSLQLCVCGRIANIGCMLLRLMVGPPPDVNWNMLWHEILHAWHHRTDFGFPYLGQAFWAGSDTKFFRP